MFDELSSEEVVTAVDRTIARLLAAAGVSGPPVDAIGIARDSRHRRMPRWRTTGPCRAQRAGKQRQIYLRPEPTKERHQWTVAHEIGEHLKAELLRALEVEPEQTGAMTGESLANLFANRLLVPQSWLAAEARGFVTTSRP